MKTRKTIKWKTRRVGWAMIISGTILTFAVIFLQMKYKDEPPQVIGVDFINMLIVVGVMMLALPNKIRIVGDSTDPTIAFKLKQPKEKKGKREKVTPQVEHIPEGDDPVPKEE